MRDPTILASAGSFAVKMADEIISRAFKPRASAASTFFRRMDLIAFCQRTIRPH